MHKLFSILPITDNGYSINGSVREIYHKVDWLDPNEFETELQFRSRSKLAKVGLLYSFN